MIMEKNLKFTLIFVCMMIIGWVIFLVIPLSSYLIFVGFGCFILGGILANFFYGRHYVHSKDKLKTFLGLIPLIIFGGTIIAIISFFIGNQFEKAKLGKDPSS
ncbi:MAG: hypothetical protein BWY55_00416 [archaeon ADurb.Bin336]|nr:MAG: hypothetical protein BWY55_00416 [archaeon ADurb.Bin336]